MATLPDMSKKIDARIVKTLMSIDAAFLKLLEEKDYNDITVQDILTAAMINRTTFYKYYENKDDLACHMVDTIKDKFLTPIIDSRIAKPWDEIKEEATELFHQNHRILSLLWRIENTNINLRQDAYVLIRKRYYDAIKKETPEIKEDDLDFQAHVYASLGVAMIAYAVNEEKITDPTQKYKNLRHVYERLLSN